jgi:hypothetical protein
VARLSTLESQVCQREGTCAKLERLFKGVHRAARGIFDVEELDISHKYAEL